ncbi:hypothetical protein SISSUDRAFT_1033994 [Sistotremastrum suecicum HHB10207 ss-3]|uniref:Uncharacterized protein n=1 Tax=Sistotremastrum suecicum HHB10207 ss-3 TaxID=1314776 RepID=A0A166CLR6_9AGAM|nr:hypothetical protein SISSUDRAFT_1033994 [Sistotremastrum suecicum HHB10207 ss-3]
MLSPPNHQVQPNSDSTNYSEWMLREARLQPMSFTSGHSQHQPPEFPRDIDLNGVYDRERLLELKSRALIFLVGSWTALELKGKSKRIAEPLTHDLGSDLSFNPGFCHLYDYEEIVCDTRLGLRRARVPEVSEVSEPVGSAGGLGAGFGFGVATLDVGMDVVIGSVVLEKRRDVASFDELRTRSTENTLDRVALQVLESAHKVGAGSILDQVQKTPLRSSRFHRRRER